MTSFSYDSKNNVTGITNPLGVTTTKTYDPASNLLLSVSQPIDPTSTATVKYEYTDSANPGLPTWITAPRGNSGASPDHTYAQNLSYDSHGNLVTKVTADGAKTTYAYDIVGRLTSSVDPEGYAPGAVPADHAWTTTYDLNDRVLSTADPLGHISSSTYDGAGKRLTATDPNGNVTSYTYDAGARLATVVQQPDPAGQPTLRYTTTITRDLNGNATSVTQANGVVTDYTFDALDRVTAVTTHPTTATTLTTTYTLDGVGQTTTKTLGDTTPITYTYDTNSRLLSVAATGITTITYAYDAASERTGMTDGTGTSTYTYDRAGRLTQAVQPNGTTTYGYDLDGNRTTLGYPTVGNVTYTYSPGGRLAGLTDWASHTASYTSTASGLAAAVSVPGGLTTTYSYDRAHRLTNLSNAVGTTTITNHAYTLDAAGNRTAQDEFVSGITTGASDHFGYTYDGLERLTAVTTTNPESFTFDAGSNVQSRTGPSATYSYDTANRLTSDGTQAFAWNADDQLQSRGTDTFTFDPLDRLTGSTVGGTARTYTYNGDGLLQYRTAGTYLLWDPATSPSRLLQLGSDRLIYGLGPLYTVHADGTTTAFARDGGKNVRGEISGAGAVSASFRYSAYGAIAQASGALAPSSLGYAGQLTDPSGLVYMRARWYDPNSARFASRDPLASASPGISNAFSYANGNPGPLGDPSGLAAISDDPDACSVPVACATPPLVDWGDAISAAVGAGLAGLDQAIPSVVRSVRMLPTSTTVGVVIDSLGATFFGATTFAASEVVELQSAGKLLVKGIAASPVTGAVVSGAMQAAGDWSRSDISVGQKVDRAAIAVGLSLAVGVVAVGAIAVGAPVVVVVGGAILAGWAVDHYWKPAIFSTRRLGTP